MLSRAASSLYWIGRYIERADFTARLIEAAIEFDMRPFPETQSGWRSALEASGGSKLSEGDDGPVERLAVREFLALARTNSSSILSCRSEEHTSEIQTRMRK